MDVAASDSVFQTGGAIAQMQEAIGPGAVSICLI